MNLKYDFDRAITYEEYIDCLGDNIQLHRLHYKKFVMNEWISQKLQKVPALDILVITEPWCGDSLAILPVVRRLFDCKILPFEWRRNRPSEEAVFDRDLIAA